MVVEAITNLVQDSPRDRAAKLREAFERDTQRLSDLRVLLAQLDDDEAMERVREVRRAPISHIDVGINTAFSKIRKQRESALKEVAKLEGEIAARAVVLGETEAQIEADARTELARTVDSGRAGVEEAWRDFAKWYAEGLSVYWPRLVEAFTAFTEVRESGWAGVVPASRVEAWRADEAAHPTPVPLDFLSAVEMAFKATCDPFGDGYVDGNSVRDGIERLTAILSTDLRQVNTEMPVQRGGTEVRASSARVLLGFEPERGPAR